MGNTTGAGIVTVSGGFGVASRRRSIGAPGTVMKHLELSTGAKHCAKILDGRTSGGVTHVSERGPKPKISGKTSVASPVSPVPSVLPGTGLGA